MLASFQIPPTVKISSIKTVEGFYWAGKPIFYAGTSAQILCKTMYFYFALNIGYPNNKAALPYLMEWFQDLNHPGVANIIELLSGIDKNELKPNIEQGILKAIAEKDEDWGLGLLTLINDLKITKLFDERLIQNLKTLANYYDD